VQSTPTAQLADLKIDDGVIEDEEGFLSLCVLVLGVLIQQWRDR